VISVLSPINITPHFPKESTLKGITEGTAINFMKRDEVSHYQIKKTIQKVKYCQSVGSHSINSEKIIEG